MKNLYKVNVFSVIFIGLIFLASCTKSSTESKLEGKWKFVNVADIYNTADFEEWEFKSDGKLVKYFRQSNPDTTIQWEWEGNYHMDSYKKFTTYGDSITWEIISRKNNTLRIVNNAEGGLLIKEFVKE